MTTTRQQDQAIHSGALHVDETEHLASGLTEPRDISADEINPESRASNDPDVKTELANVTLSMFTQGTSTRVRVGNPHNASELYEQIYASPEEANAAMVDGGILTEDQIPNSTEPAGTGIVLTGITVEQLEAAGLKRHGASTI